MTLLPRNAILAAGLTLLLAPVAFSQTPAGSPPSQDPSVAPPRPAATDQEEIVAYWTTETGWMSELQLRNNLVGVELTVTPALRLADGAETALAPITLKPQEVKSIDLDAGIGSAAPHLVGTYGSLALRYHSIDRANLYAAIMVRNIGHPFAFHIDASADRMK